MVNKPKAKGTAAETAVLRHVRGAGFPYAERLTLAGISDRGDISLLPGVAAMIEVKSHAVAATGQPGELLLARWLLETERERANAGADIALLVVKRKGTADAGRWWAYWRLGDFLALMGFADAPPDPLAPVCMSLDSALALLRARGYGAPLPDLEAVGA